MITEINHDVALQELAQGLKDLQEKLQTGYPYRNGYANRHLRKVLTYCNEIGVEFGGKIVTHNSEIVS